MAFPALKSVLSVVLLLFFLVVGLATLGLLLAPLSDSVVVMERTIDTLAESLLAVPLGVVLGLAWIHPLNWIARITGTLAVALLRPTEPTG